MYQTQKAAYVDFSELGSHGLHWRYVEHSLNEPWFYISLTRRVGAGKLKTMLQTMDPAVLHALVANSVENIEVGDVMLVTPSFINGTGKWLMETLLEFSQFDSKIWGRFDVFRVTGNRTYTTNPQVEPGELDENEGSIIYRSIL